MFNPKTLKFFIAVPLDEGGLSFDPFKDPEHFHIVDFDYDTAAKIGNSPFSSLAFEKLDNYPIELFEDPFFEQKHVHILLQCLEKWRESLDTADELAFQIVESMLIEAKERNTGIYFKL